MSKADVIEVEGVVVEKLPNAFFKVELENGHQILVSASHRFLRLYCSLIVTRLRPLWKKLMRMHLTWR